METYEKWNIQEMPVSTPFFRVKVERFLGENGLRMESLDVYYCLQNVDGDILAGAGLAGDVVKCVAVREDLRSEGLLTPLFSHLMSQRGGAPLKLFTKPEYRTLFESMGFRLLAQAPKAILMENGRGLERYGSYLRGLQRQGRCGVVVMNANPFTLGHQYLLEQSSQQVDTLFVIPVKEDGQRYSYAERKQMIESADAAVMPGRDRASRVVVLEGSDYQISAATFPTYFLKDLSDAAETQMRLDIDLFARHIAPALGATVRFVGSEPSDALTARYNTLLKELLPIEVVEIERLTEGNYFSQGFSKNQFPSACANPTHAEAVSASAVRAALDRGRFPEAAALCPETTWPYLLADLAERALRTELDTPLKPGLVGPDSNGAHTDMDYNTMLSGIHTLRPFWPRMVLAPSASVLIEVGIEAEQAMLTATGGVNTHRGAIFCLGVSMNAWAQCVENEKDMQLSIGIIAGGILAFNQKINNLPPRAAMQNALDGYRELFQDWLPYFRNALAQNTAAQACQKTLLRIMGTLDDTCVIKRVGYERAQQVKREARELSEGFSEEKLKELCKRYAAEGISPGGAADMLALTLFIDSITKIDIKLN